MKADDERHGSRRGAVAHRRDGEKPCDPCRVADNAYMSEFRKVNRESTRRQAARSRALWQLAQRHPDEYRELFYVEVLRDRAEQAS